jgi:hypothetical protein
MNKTILTSLLLLTTACSSDKVDDIQNPNAMPVETSTSMSVVQEPKSISKSKDLVVVKDSPSLNKTHSYKLNGQKFTSNTDLLVKGSPVSSPTMSEVGVLKGSFVIITKKIVQLPLGYQVDKIAKETYRLTPLDTQDGLYALYSDLLKNANFTRVEIEIDFSGPSGALEY